MNSNDKIKGLVEKLVNDHYVLKSLADINKQDVQEYLFDMLTNNGELRNAIHSSVERETHENDIELALHKNKLPYDNNIITLLTDEYECELEKNSEFDLSLDTVITNYTIINSKGLN